MDGATLDLHVPAEQSVSGGKIGPNSVIQLGETVVERMGETAARALYLNAGVPHLLERPPDAMIDERVPAALFSCLFDLFPENATDVAQDAGRRTADYIIAHRIPRVAQIVLRLCPRAVAAGLLLKAIRQHAWTFAGSGVCHVHPGAPHLLSIKDNPLAMPNCAWHRAVLEQLFNRLIAKGAKVRHTACCIDGATDCRFEITLPRLKETGNDE